MRKGSIFTDKWQFTSLPKVKSNKKVDCCKLVSLGSCFANNFLAWLYHHKYIEKKQQWGILYNPFSIQAEFNRLFAFVEWKKYIINEFDFKTNQNVLVDPWRSWHVAKDLNGLTKLNYEFDLIARQIVLEASGFLVTFGLSEVWSLATKPEIILNRVPLKTIQQSLNLWENRFASIIEVQSAIMSIVRNIRQYIGNDKLIIFTLSPVPLKYTASNLTIREANNLSKSTILVALHNICSYENNVMYFPSYEMVQALSEADYPVWQDDGRHVTTKVVNLITRKFLEIYDIQQTLIESCSNFNIPLVDNKGKVIGRLYLDGSRVIF